MTDMAGMSDLTDLDVARAIASGELASPQPAGNATMFDLRISGAGVAQRRLVQGVEIAVRDARDYCSPEFMAMCNAAPVLWDHAKGGTLDSSEFAKKIIGMIVFPFVRGDEARGIARIYDDEAARLMREGKLSTSPAIVWRDEQAMGEQVDLGGGRTLLIEGRPSALDHLAVVPKGVWDKDGAAEPGVRVDAMEDDMAENEDRRGGAFATQPNGEQPNKDLPEPPDEHGTDIVARLDKLIDGVDKLSKAHAKMDQRLTALETGGAQEEKRAVGDSATVGTGPKPGAEEELHRVAADRAMRARKPWVRSDDDRKQLVAAQVRGDRIAHAFAEQAPPPMVGETPRDYRERLLMPYQRHCNEFKEVRLDSLDEATFAGVESSIYAAAARAAEVDWGSGAPDILRERKTRDDSGRLVSTFHGSGPHLWMDQFKSSSRRVTRFNTDKSQR